MNAVIETWSDYVHQFRFEAGEVPLTSPTYVCTLCILYLAMVHLLPRTMSSSKPYRLTSIVQTHNLLLAVFSGVLAVALSFTVLQRAAGHSFHWAACSQEMHDSGALQFIYYVNYHTKVYEFGDTLLMILRGRKVPFLHWYHHVATFLLTYTQMRFASSVQWVPIVLNLWVHTIMYYYYYLAGCGVRVWWKRYVTVIQLAQFVLDLCACCYASTLVFIDASQCPGGTVPAAISGVFILGSYLVLFILFYRNTYTKKRDISVRTTSSKSKSVPLATMSNHTSSTSNGYNCEHTPTDKHYSNSNSNGNSNGYHPDSNLRQRNSPPPDVSFNE